VILAAVLSLAIGLSLGMLGGGGSILTVPILVYALGVEQRVAMADSLLVTGFTSLVALVRPARSGQVSWRTGAIFAAGGMLGSFLGERTSASVPKRALIVVFLLMMVATGLAMLRSRKEPETAQSLQPGKVLATGLVVGVLTGLVGAGGGFVIVPALALIGGLPMRSAVGTSLFVIALQSFTGFAGHASHLTIDVPLVAVVTGSASVGAVAGGLFATRVKHESLRRAFGVVVLAMASYVGWRELRPVNATAAGAASKPGGTAAALSTSSQPRP
jgi:uncharacterized membrane protein YfcA